MTDSRQMALEAMIGELGLAATHLSRYDAPGVPMNFYAALCHKAADMLNCYAAIAAKVEPVAYLAWRDGKPCWEGDDCVCEDSVYPVSDDDDRTSMPLYAAPQQAEIEALTTERDEARQKFNQADLMAECTTMLRDDLIEAGIVDKTVPPMMLTEAIMRYVQTLTAERDALQAAIKQQLSDMGRQADDLRANADRLDWMQSHMNYEFSTKNDDGDLIFEVHKVTGYPNDREWHKVAEGITLREALDAVRATS